VTPDGSRIVTGSEDRTARIWDASKSEELARLTGHQDVVSSVAVTPDGSRIITGSADARIWKLFPYGQALIDDAKNVVPRCLTSAERDRYYLPQEPPRWCTEMKKWPYSEAG
jgi:WD40 repeat protein